MEYQEEAHEPRPVISTKFLPPHLRKDIILRPELIKRIHENLPKGVVLISAPAGFGKTTLAAAWAAQSSLPLVWLTIDPLDDNPQSFIQSFFQAFQFSMPDSASLDAEIFHPYEAAHSIQKDVITFINQAEKSGIEFNAVLDNLHSISNEEIIHALGFLLDNLPSNLHLLLLSRSDPDIPFARLRACNRLSEIRTADMRFNRDECSLFLNRTMKLKLSGEEIDTLTRRSEGWVTGLQLAAISLQNKQPVADLSGLLSGDNTYILDFLVEEVYEQQPPELKNFLLRTSILEIMTGPLCEALLEGEPYQSRGGEILHELYHENLFLNPLDNREHWFRYHPLFAESLQHILSEKIPDEIPYLHRLACHWYFKNNLPELAIRHALFIEDYEYMMEIIKECTSSLLSTEGILTLLEWIDVIPDELIHQKPELCVMYAWGLAISYETDTARYWLDVALRSLKATPQTGAKAEISETTHQNDQKKDNLLGQIYAIQSILAAQHGQQQEANRLNQQAMQLLNKENIILQNYISTELCLTSLLDLDLVRLDRQIKDSIRISKASGIWMLAIIARVYRGASQCLRGQLTKAWDTYQQSIQFTIDAYGKIMPFVGYIYSEMAAILIERNELSEAQQFLSQGIEISKDWFPVVLAMQAQLRMAYLKTIMGNPQEARSEIEKAYVLANTTDNEFDDLMISTQEARLALYHGDWRACLNWAQREGFLEDLPTRWQPNLPFSFVTTIQTNLARMWLWRSRSERNPDYAAHTLYILHDLKQRLETRECIQIQIEVFTLQALAYQELDESEKALTTLQHALQLGEAEGFRRVFLDEGVYLARLMSRLLAQLKKEHGTNIFPTQEYLLELLSLFSSGQEDNDAPIDFGNTPGSGHSSWEDKNSILPELYAIDLLTPREKEVLSLVAAGASNAEIAQELYLALNTVKRHLNNIFIKLGASTRTQAVAIARKLGILE